MSNSQKIALFDMDGTLFDYEEHMRLSLVKLCNKEETDLVFGVPNLWTLEEKLPYMKNRMDLIKRQPGWWKNLPKLSAGWVVLRQAQMMGFDIHILSKGPSNNPGAWGEKLECIRTHFHRDEDVSVHLTEDKSVHYGRVLVDDYPEYMDKWLEHRPRGLGIMPAQRYNESYQHPRVVRYMAGTNEGQVLEALRRAFTRPDGQLPHAYF